MTAEELRFGFGHNWSNFVDAHLTEERIAEAQRHLLRFLNLPDLRGRTFLDIGCGSGLHSLAALRAGADRIESFDYDPHSVATSTRLREFAGGPAHWTVRQGSVLDAAFMATLAPADIVYSWGVLHHTGAMWQAIRNATIPLRPDGVFYIALYTTDVHLDPTPQYWLDVKRRYNMAPLWRKRFMELRYAWDTTILPDLRNRRNPLDTIGHYAKSRGMAYWTDVRDWLGGYPMEFAGIAETKRFAADDLELELLNISAGEANTEYLFRHRGTHNYWDIVAANRALTELVPPFAAEDGYAFRAALPQFQASADDLADPRRSRLMLFEDDTPVGFAHQTHVDIARHGAGRYSHWREHVIFSTLDNTDPNHNGRRYRVCPDGLP